MSARAAQPVALCVRRGAANDGSSAAFDLRGSVFARVPADYDVFARVR